MARRRWPVPACMAALGMSAVHLGGGLLPPEPVDLSALICLFTVADRTRRALSLPVALTCVTVAVAASQALSSGRPFGYWQNTGATGALLLIVAWFAGDNIRARRGHLVHAERRAADAERDRDRDRDRDRQAQLAAAAERERLSRELHDVIAHSLSVIVVQAQGAEAALDDAPDKARTALGSVLATGRQALAEMRILLGIERTAGDGEPAPAPPRGLGQLPSLLSQMGKSGLHVSLATTGEPRLLEAGVYLSAFRVIQESLTNTLRHAGQGTSASPDW